MNESGTCLECGRESVPRGGLGVCASCAFRMALDMGQAPDWFESGPEGTSRTHGDYDLLEEIGRGGAGVVFRARQRSLNREVALKVLYAGPFADASGKDRLLAEARVVARLRHPNIVGVHEAGELDGQPYFAMEWVQGRSLAEVAATGPISPIRAARWMQKVAAAIAHAHASGVLHRDLKPSNILLDAQDEPRVADFGLAKLLDGEWAASMTMGVRGSPAYMAPEQAEGKTEMLGPPVDVHGMGAVLYELVTGRPPFSGSTIASVLESVRSSEPLPPRALNPAVPADLENVILKCLRKEPGKRYATAALLEEDLTEFLAGRPVRARPVGKLEKVWRQARRRPFAASALVGMVLAAAAMAMVWVVSAHQVRVARDAAQERLAESLLESVRVLRLAREPGWRGRSLERIAEAQAVDVRGKWLSALRNEAVAAMAESDFEWVKATVPLVPGDANPEMLVCFQRDFQRLAAWNPDTRQIDILSVPDGRRMENLAARWPDEVRAFSACGRYLSLRYRNAMAVWDTTTGKEVLSAEDGAGYQGFSSGAFAPDRALFARAEAGGNIVVYQMDEGMARRIAAWPLPVGKGCSGLDWSIDGGEIVVITGGRMLVVHKMETGEIRWQREFKESVSQVAWRNRAGRVCAITGAGRLVILDAASGETVDQVGLPTDGSTTARFSPDGTVLAASGSAFGTRFWDATTLEPLGKFDPVAWHIEFSEDGHQLGTHHHQNAIWFLRKLPPLLGTTWSRPGAMPDHPGIAVDAEGKRIATADDDGPNIWNAFSGNRIGGSEIPHARKVAALPNRLGFLCADDKSVWEVPADGGVARKIQPAEAGAILGLPGGGILIAGKGRGQLHHLTPTGTKEIAIPKPAERLAANGKGRWVACSREHEDGVYLIDLANPDRPAVRLEGAGPRCAFSSNGSLLLTCGQLPILWLIKDGQPVVGPPLPLASNNRGEMIAAISPDGAWIAATQNDREVHLVEVATGTTLVVLPAPASGIVSDVAFSGDGHVLVVASGRGDLRVWPLPALRGQLAGLGLDW